MFSIRLLLAVVAVAATASQPKALAGMAVFHLGTLSGGASATPAALNNSGLVGGRSSAPTASSKATLFSRLQGEQNMDLKPGNGWSEVRGISDTGQVVGWENGDAAYLFDATGDGNHVNLGAGRRAYAINNNNIVVGGSGNGNQSKAWLWNLDTSTTPILLGNGGEAVAVSDSGHVVGSSYEFNTNARRATRFDATGNGNNIDLGTLFQNDDRSFATAVNAAGSIVGHSGGPGSGYTATLYDKSGGKVNIALGAIGHSRARGINNLGQIVGQEHGRATLFDSTGNGNNIDLNSLGIDYKGWVLTDAFAINDNGWIIGTGNFGAYMLAPDDAFPYYLGDLPGQPVPEPACIVIWAFAGGLGLLMVRRRKRTMVA